MTVPSKSALLSKEVCCKVCLCENFQQQSCTNSWWETSPSAWHFWRKGV